MSQPATLLFDLDGTLVDSAKPITEALSVLSQQRGGPPVLESKVRNLVSLGASALVEGALGSLAKDNENDVAAFREILTAIPTDPAWAYPHACSVIEELSSQGHKLAVVTNKPENLSKLLLDDLTILQFFQAVVGGDTLTISKPEPDPLHHAIKLVGGSPSSALMIGDSAVDCAAARAANIPFLLYLGGYGAQECPPQHVSREFSDFAALRELIASWDATRFASATSCDNQGPAAVVPL